MNNVYITAEIINIKILFPFADQMKFHSLKKPIVIIILKRRRRRRINATKSALFSGLKQAKIADTGGAKKLGSLTVVIMKQNIQSKRKIGFVSSNSAEGVHVAYLKIPMNDYWIVAMNFL